MKLNVLKLFLTLLLFTEKLYPGKEGNSDKGESNGNTTSSSNGGSEATQKDKGAPPPPPVKEVIDPEYKV